MRKIITEIDDLILAKAISHYDARGSFTRLFCESELSKLLKNRQIKQINCSKTAEVGSVRGIHFQNFPNAEMKFVRCLSGKVWDVAVDLRFKSHSFLKWHAEELTAENGLMMIIPEGFGHGFQVLEPNSELLYFHTSFYDPVCEGGVKFDDPAVAINWPLKPINISERDNSFARVDINFKGCIV